jgi:DAK2 domain fusion protein YloV
MSAVTSLDGRAFEKFFAAGTYFLRKYRGVLNDLNVFPVPDGDTGSNMYLTAKAALREAQRVAAPGVPLHVVAEAAAHGSLLGARGNSGVILSQLLRGFAHNVRHRSAIDTFQLAIAMKDAVAVARAALTKPVEGTIISVASAAADEAYRVAMHEPDFYRFANAVLRAANAALDRTPEQLPQLKEAGVVDSGGAGFVYFLEGVLRFLPHATVRATAFPRRPLRSTVFTRAQSVGEHRFCTEFILEDATIEAHPLGDLLAAYGDSLIVAGGAPVIKVHLHTGDPAAVQTAAARYGTLTRLKVENMEEQHNVLIEQPVKPFAFAAVVPGSGFAQMARELGADVTIPLPPGANPSVRELLIAVNATLAERVYLLPNDLNVALAAREVAALTKKTVIIVPTVDILQGLSVLLDFATDDELPDTALIERRIEGVTAGALFFAGKETSAGGVAVRAGAPVARAGGEFFTGSTVRATMTALVRALGGDAGGLVTIYYGGAQKERDAQRVAAEIGEAFAEVSVEYYYGGGSAIEYWVSVER